MMSTPPQHGPVRVTEASRVAFQPATRATITGGFWAERRRVNRDVTVPSTWHRLHQAGNIANLEAAAGIAGDEYMHTVTFLDSDVYKSLEAVGWTLVIPCWARRQRRTWPTTSTGASRCCLRLRPTTVISTLTTRSSFQARGSRNCSGGMSCTAPATSFRPQSPCSAVVGIPAC